MAATLELKWSSTTLDLIIAKGTGWETVSWKPQAGMPGSNRPVVETITLLANRTTDDLLASSLQGLDLMRVWAARYMADPTSERPVWLHVKMDAETAERRALVRSISLEWLTDEIAQTGYSEASAARVRIKIEREPWWQHTTREEGKTLAETAGTLLTCDYTTAGSFSLPGDVPARLNRLRIHSDASGAEVDRLWMGFRSDDKHPDLGNFVGVWECEDGTNTATDAADDAASDVNGASPGSGSGAYVKIVASAEDWDTVANGGSDSLFYEVLQMVLSDVSANEQDNFGDYLWMLRHQLAANATTWEVQLRWGYSGMSDDDFVRGPIVELDSTGWDYAELGRQRIPLRDLQALSLSLYGEDHEATYAVQIWARRTSGAAELRLDCLCLVPIDEGWLKSWNFHIAAGTAGHWIYGQGPRGEEQAMVYGTTTWTHLAAVASSNFHVPVGYGRLYILYAGATAHDLTVGISVPALTFATRWINLRGSEAIYSV